MAISIDTVYQKVLMIANKEQRGYITPQEFNLFADHAQKEIFEQYFYDLNQVKRVHGNSGEYSDIIDNIREKITPFEKSTTIVGNTNPKSINTSDLYRLGTVRAGGVNGIEVEEVQENELLYLYQSPLTKPTTTRPIYVRTSDTQVSIYPPNLGVQAQCTYIKKPSTPSWGYFIVGNKALYDSSNSKTTDFELHASEESELVYKILKLAGITLNKPGLSQSALNLEESKAQKEKQ